MDFPRTVYAIKHNKTGRMYIGSSRRPDVRLKSHFASLKRGKHPVEDMQSDFDEFGDDYTIIYLEEITEFRDRSHEYDWMRMYCTHIRGKGYNYKDIHVQPRKRSPVVARRKEIQALLREVDDISTLDLVRQLLKKKVTAHAE